MKTVLHISTTATQGWQKGKSGWQMLTGPATGPVWAVTDLAEEDFAPIRVPRLFGRDRSDYIQRQLANRFPSTPFRAAVAGLAGAGFMERVLPSQQLLVGVDAAERIQSAVDSQRGALAGLWTQSMLMALLGRHPQLPPALFVVMPGRGKLRIVFLKDRVPVLTRLAPLTDQASEQAQELARTLRHLENTRVIARSGQRYAVLFLGESVDLGPDLAALGLDLLAPPAPWSDVAAPDWQGVLFDLALQSPVGHLAPLQQRGAFLGQRLGRICWAATALCLGLAVWAADHQARAAWAAQEERAQVLAQVRQVQAGLTKTEQALKHAGVPPQALRQAVSVYQRELAGDASMAQAMLRVAQVVGSAESLRARRFEWRHLPTGEAACAGAAALPGGAARPAGVNAEPRAVELKLELGLEGDSTPLARSQIVAEISRKLSQLPGSKLLLDPQRERARQALSSEGGREALHWCLALARTRDADPDALAPRPRTEVLRR